MKKRLCSWLLVLVMLLGMFPVSAFAVENSGESITVYVTISNKGVLAADKYGDPMGYREVTVTDLDEDGKLTVYDAYTAAHTLYCDSEFLVNGSGLVGQLWGYTNGFLTFVNNAGIPGDPLKNQVIADGSHLLGVILTDTAYWSDYISFFDFPTKTASVGNDITLTLKGRAGMTWTGEDDPDAALSGLSVGTWNDGSFSALPGKTTDENGQVTLSFDTAGTYYVTANGSVHGFAPIIAPVCIVTVNPVDAAAVVAADKASLTVTYVDGENLSLPAKGDSDNTTIIWSSGNTAVISNTGVVTKQETTQTVTLTATIKCGEVSDTKEFELNIPAITNVDRLNAAKAVLTESALTPVEYTGKKDNGYAYASEVKDTNILTMAQELVRDVNANAALAFANDFDGGTVIGTDGTITYPADAATPVSLKFTLSLGDDSVDHSLDITVPKHAQTKAEAIDAMKAAMPGYMEDAKVLNGNTFLNEVKTTLLLPGGKTSGLYITWASNNESVIKVTGNPSSTPSHPTGGKYEVKVNRPNVGEQDATVKLTATFAYKTTSVICGAGPMPESGNSMEFTVTVPAVTEEEMQAIVDGAAADIKITDKNGAVADLANISDNLYFPSYEGYTTKWETNLPITIPSKGYDKSTVTRPANGTDDEGTITVTITKGEVSKTKTFDAKVLAWTADELATERAKLQKVADGLTFDEIKNKNAVSTGVTSNLYLKQSAKLDGEQVAFSTYNSGSYPYAISWSITPNDGTVSFNNGTGTVTRPTFDKQVTLEATISLKQPIASVEAVKKSIVITVSGLYDADSLDGMKLVMDNIAATCDDDNDSDDWIVLDMGAYAKLFPGAAAKTSATAKQTYINGAVSMLKTGKIPGGWDASAGDYAKAILALSAAGIDPAQLYAVNSNTMLDTCAKLKSMSFDSHYSAPHVLLANQFGGAGLSETQLTSLVALLKDNQLESGLFGYEYGGQSYTDFDTTAAAVAGLAGLYSTNEAAKAVVEKAITGLSSAQTETGSFGNANSDAMVIIALAAMGINPDTDDRFIKNGNSVLDGLLSYITAEDNGFGYNNNSANDLATEQGFRALIAAYGVMSTGEAYNVYDFSGNSLTPGRATGSGVVTAPEDSSGDAISVTVTVKSDSGYWLNSKSVTVPGTGATVYHALVKALEGSGITQVGAAGGYVKSMTKDGRTLAEFGSGKNSGWMYKVNGVLPEVGLTTCAIADGDSIVWFYTDDWTTVPGASGSFGGSTTEKETAVSISGSNSAVQVDAVVAGNKATVEKIDLSQLNTDVGDHADTGTVTIDFSTLDSKEPVTTVELPAAAIKQIAEAVNDPANDAHSLEIVLSGGASIAFDAAALKEKASQASGLDITVSTESHQNVKLTNEQKKALGDRPAFAISVTSGGKPISDMGGKITAHVPYVLKPNEKARGIVVWYVDDLGNKERCVSSYDPIKKRVNWETNHLSLYMIDYDERLANNPFTDIGMDNYYFDAVLWAAEKGLTSGTSETTFSPDMSCTRAQMVTFLWRAAGSPETAATCSFTDVDPDAYYYEALLWAVENGITNGTSATTFSPNTDCARGQMAIFLYRNAKNPAVSGSNAFTDIAETAYYKDAVIWAKDTGVTLGTGADTFSPDAPCSRGQMVTFLYRYLAE